jgi:hypothetical protein
MIMRLAFQSTLGNAIDVVSQELNDIEGLLATTKHPRDLKTLDSVRAKLKAVLRDLAYCHASMNRVVTASAYEGIINRIAFKLGTTFGDGGGLIRPNGIAIPVRYAGHTAAGKQELVDMKIMSEDEAEKQPQRLKYLSKLGYIIVHSSRSSEWPWTIEYDVTAAPKSNLKELADYLMVNRINEFEVHTQRGEKRVSGIEALEEVFGV